MNLTSFYSFYLVSRLKDVYSNRCVCLRFVADYSFVIKIMGFVACFTTDFEQARLIQLTIQLMLEVFE